MPNAPKTPMRGVRISDNTWALLGKIAKEKGLQGPSAAAREILDKATERYAKKQQAT